ncbi:hypothetical protein PFTANZ_01644 [Plasmodium falciparum Tanzania (2000708)]|uniref:Uncharacterized protein n=1 Tax=Plasmodium falciparum Tanzania (2000708) TaxID=1036725 RepID=A0A024WBP2_PLAFA|nr:hypothetical protein PFTANZ_01644 [Plasmodium falciparum Tanzania (2000708)]
MYYIFTININNIILKYNMRKCLYFTQGQITKNHYFSAKIFVECEKVALNYNNIYYISFKERKMFLFKHII